MGKCDLHAAGKGATKVCCRQEPANRGKVRLIAHVSSNRNKYMARSMPPLCMQTMLIRIHSNRRDS